MISTMLVIRRMWVDHEDHALPEVPAGDSHISKFIGRGGYNSVDDLRGEMKNRFGVGVHPRTISLDETEFGVRRVERSDEGVPHYGYKTTVIYTELLQVEEP